MALRLFEHPNHPGRVAASEIDSFVVDGLFFLDFTRPLELRRRFGFALGAFVPVVHQGEKSGGYVVGIERSDPSFSQVQELWAAHHPASAIELADEADGLKIIADFASQFPSSA